MTARPSAKVAKAVLSGRCKSKRHEYDHRADRQQQFERQTDPAHTGRDPFDASHFARDDEPHAEIGGRGQHDTHGEAVGDDAVIGRAQNTLGGINQRELKQPPDNFGAEFAACLKAQPLHRGVPPQQSGADVSDQLLS